jgi:peptide/nickel transport system permease protein
MGRFVLRRLLGMVPFIFLVSVTVFVLIKLPPGDFVTNYAAALAASGETVDDSMLAGCATGSISR